MRICFFHAIFSLHISNLQLNLYTGCISPDISSVFSMCTKQLNIGEEFRAEQKFSYYFIIVYYCFYFQILKAGGLPCYNLDRRTAAISHVFLSATTKEKKMYKSKKFEDLTISDDFMFGIVMRDPKYCKPFLETILNIKITRS